MAVDLDLLNANSIPNIDTNFIRVQTALQDAVSRSGGLPNHMDSDLDMNGNDLLNIRTLNVDDISIGGDNVTGILERAEEAVILAEAAAVEADASADIAVQAAIDAEAAAESVRNNYTTSSFTGDGVTTSFALATDPGSIDNLIVFIEGVYQEKNSYTLVGLNVVFGVAPPLNLTVEIKYGNAVAVNTPADGSVTTAKIVDANVTAAKLASNSVTTAKITDGNVTTAKVETAFGNTLTAKTTPVAADTFLMNDSAASGAFKKVTFANLAANLAGARPAFVAHKNGTNQTGVASVTETKVTFGTEQFDVGSYYDTTNSRWTPPAGLVEVSAVVGVSGTLTANGTTYLAIRKNGVAFKTGAGVNGGNTGVSGASISIIDQANGTDYYEVFVFLTTSAGTGTIAGTAVGSYFQGVVL